MPEGTVESGLQKTEGICGRVCTQYVHGHRLELPGIVRLRESPQQRQHIRAGIFSKIAQTGDFYIRIIGTFQQLQYLRTPVGGGEANKIHQCSLHGVGASEPIPQLPDERFSGLKMLQPLYQHLPVDGQSLRPVQGRQCPEDQRRVSGSIEGLQCIFCTAKVVLLLQQPKKKGNQPIIGIKGEHPVFGQERGIAGAGMKACVAVVFLQQSQYLGGQLAGSRLLLQLLHSLVKGQQPADSAEPVAQPRYLIAQLSL